MEGQRSSRHQVLSVYMRLTPTGSQLAYRTSTVCKALREFPTRGVDLRILILRFYGVKIR